MQYHETGTGEVPLILLHGWGISKKQWQNYHDYLPGERVISFDFIGFGDGDKPLGESFYTPDTFARQIKDICDEAKVKKAILIGNSLGGVAASHFSTLYPKMVEKLVIVSAPVLGKRMMILSQRLPFYFPAITNMIKAHPALIRRYFKKIIVNPATIPEHFFEDVPKISDDACKASVKSLRNIDYTEHFRSMDIPLVYISGDRWHDTLGLKQINTLSTIAKDFRYGIVPNAQHYTMVENPKGFLGRLVELGVVPQSSLKEGILD